MKRPSDEQLRRMGRSLREIDPKTLNRDEDGSEVRWFLGESGTELFAWHRAGAPAHHLQLVFAGVTVEWDDQHGLRTGAFEGGAAIAGGRYDPYLVRVSAGADPEVSRAALTLLEARGPDAPDVADPMLVALRSAVTAAV